MSWPTNEQLERMGFVRCASVNGEPCSAWIEPGNVRKPPGEPEGSRVRRCREHHSRYMRQRKVSSLSEVRYAPRRRERAAA